MQQEQLLKAQIMSSKEWLMGTTPAGADWCIKALHPSDPLTQVRGIPDMSAATSLCMNYQTTFTLSAQPGATGTWSWESTLLPHPINFMATQAHDSVGDMNYEVLNAQITGANHAGKAAWLSQNAQQWRLAYAGVTVTQDGPDLANQGTIVVSQGPVIPFTYTASTYEDGARAVSCTQPVQVYTAEDLPSYTSSQSMPSAYFDVSKKGVYVPLKLTKTCQTWRSQIDMTGTGKEDNLTEGVYEFPQSETFAWPHWELPCTRATVALPAATTTVKAPGVANVTFANYVTSPMLNDVMAHICAKNLAVTTSFSFFFRYGIEMRVQPASALSPQLELAPRYDERALTTYFAISRELKDAYEAKYNDLGKLWTTISGVAKEILPIVGKFGPVGQAVQGAASGIVTLGDQIQVQRRNKRRRNKNKAKKLTISQGKRGPANRPQQL